MCRGSADLRSSSGGLDCLPQDLLLQRIELQGDESFHREDAVTLSALPIQGGMQLTVYGHAFLAPAYVMLGGMECQHVKLLNDAHGYALPNVTYFVVENGIYSEVHDFYGSMVTCDVPCGAESRSHFAQRSPSRGH
jgi:hypothetical protein